MIRSFKFEHGDGKFRDWKEESYSHRLVERLPNSSQEGGDEKFKRFNRFY